MLTGWSGIFGSPGAFNFFVSDSSYSLMYTVVCLPSNKIPLQVHVESDQLVSGLSDSKALFSLICYLCLTAEWRLCPCFCLNPCVFSAQQMLLHICVSVFVKEKTVRITNGGIYRVSLCYSMCAFECIHMVQEKSMSLYLYLGPQGIWGGDMIDYLSSWKSFKWKQNGLSSR